MISKIKNGQCSVPIRSFVGLKKIYTYVTKGDYECERVKAINKNVVETICKDYKNDLFHGVYVRHEMNRSQSKDHNIKTCKIDKINLSFNNEKNIYLTTDTIGYYIFINLLVNHAKRK